MLNLPEALLPLTGEPLQSTALELNSRNFKLVSGCGAYLLKRWSPKTHLKDLENTLQIMSWLSGQSLPVPCPLVFKNGSTVLVENKNIWTMFPFIDGDYFSGSGIELENSAEMTGRLLRTLENLPEKICIGNGPEVLENKERELLAVVESQSKNWESMFGNAHAELLSEWWSVIKTEWDQLSENLTDRGPIQACHFDLHPHNLLVRNQFVVGLLDFESCKRMSIGHPLGFAALKQCRQAMVVCADVQSPASIGLAYSEILSDICPNLHNIISRIGDFAVAEALRRICLILRLNIERNDRTWNKVLPIQIYSLGEARALFG